MSNNDLAALSADELHGLVDQYVGAGYQLLSESIDKQVARLLTFISSYYSPESSDYLHAKQLIDSCYALMSYDMASTSFITVRLDQLRERVN